VLDYNKTLLQADFIEDGRTSLARNPDKRWGRRDPKIIKGVVFHQSLDNYGTVHGNARYHSQPNHISSSGLPALSYTLFSDRAIGVMFLANDVEDVPYSQGNRHIPGDENELYLSVCFGGNFSGPGYRSPKSMKLTDAQKDHGLLVWDLLKKTFGLQQNQLFGHYHFGKAACPGYELMYFIEQVREDYYVDADNVMLGTDEGRQAILKGLGFYHSRIDGEWGPQSKYALTLFQKAHNLNPDGVWGPKTEAAAEKALKR
jgi:hypothetical protein